MLLAMGVRTWDPRVVLVRAVDPHIDYCRKAGRRVGITWFWGAHR